LGGQRFGSPMELMDYYDISGMAKRQADMDMDDTGVIGQASDSTNCARNVNWPSASERCQHKHKCED
jgi:hypothetical protein